MAALRQANNEEEHKRAIFAAPYASYDNVQNFHEARGYQRGLAHAIEILDREVT